MEKSNILIEIMDEIGWLKINRPESLNALNSEVIESMDYFLNILDQDMNVKVIVIAGVGEKAFAAGGDIKEMATMSPQEAQTFAHKGQKMIMLIEKMAKPVIAAVNGYALGGGFELALACDFIYASENAKFGLPEVTLGVIPGFGGTQNLARLIGPNKAKELIFTGRIIQAQQAKEWGIISEVFSQEGLQAEVIEVARSIARNGTIAVGNAKKAVVGGLNMGKEEGLRYESSLFATLFATQDQREGMHAFITKRNPEFKGK